MISTYFERGRFARVLRAAGTLLGGDGEANTTPREPYMQGVTLAMSFPGSYVAYRGRLVCTTAGCRRMDLLQPALSAISLQLLFLLSAES
jgi:hypothetical protein